MEENNNPIVYVIFAVVIAMMVGMFFTFFKMSNEVHDRIEKVEKEIDKKKEEDLVPPEVDLRYPNFTDGTYTLDKVQAFCDKYGIKLTVLYDEVTTYEDGLVFYQDGCMPGEKVVPGCEMTIKVAQH